MQFKSILAVLALAVAVIATPMEPAAVNLNPANLVKRTTSQEVCNSNGKVAAVCTANKKTISADNIVISIVLSLLGVLQDLKCVVANNNINVSSGTKIICCDKSNNSNTQTGNLIAINNQASCSDTEVV